ncbi:MAG TPA: ion transporter [Sphingomicrobium sp.]|nr:ion transporter [Sphingomicrobium sp.]
MTSWQSFRLRAYRQLEPTAWPRKGLSPTNWLLAFLIILAVASAVLETEPTISNGHEMFFDEFEVAVASIFLVEYLFRVWTVVENPRFKAYRFPRLRYAVTPIAIIDLAAILPAFFAFGGASSLVLRFFRVFRMIRLAKLGRTSRAWRTIREAILERRHEFALVLGLVAVTMLISSSLMYWAEADAQPEKFGSIPRALWWSIVTLTTVGYGDVYPVTVLGRICAAVIAMTGVMLIAIPTGIFAASFSEGLQRFRDSSLRDDEEADA